MMQENEQRSALPANNPRLSWAESNVWANRQMLIRAKQKSRLESTPHRPSDACNLQSAALEVPWTPNRLSPTVWFSLSNCGIPWFPLALLATARLNQEVWAVSGCLLALWALNSSSVLWLDTEAVFWAGDPELVVSSPYKKWHFLF